MSFRFVRDLSASDKLEMAKSIMNTRDMSIARKGPDEFGDRLQKCHEAVRLQPEDMLVIVNDRTINLIKGRI